MHSIGKRTFAKGYSVKCLLKTEAYEDDRQTTSGAILIAIFPVLSHNSIRQDMTSRKKSDDLS